MKRRSSTLVTDAGATDQIREIILVRAEVLSENLKSYRAVKIETRIQVIFVCASRAICPIRCPWRSLRPTFCG